MLIFEILIPSIICFLLIKFRFKGKILFNETKFLYETLISLTFLGGLIGLYLNGLQYDFIDHIFNKASIIVGLVSTLLLVLSYRTQFRKTFFFIDLSLWLFVLIIKGGYCCGFATCTPYPSIILFDIASTLLRLLILRKLVFEIKPIVPIFMTIILIAVKAIFLKYPLIEKIEIINYWR